MKKAFGRNFLSAIFVTSIQKILYKLISAIHLL